MSRKAFTALFVVSMLVAMLVAGCRSGPDEMDAEAAARIASLEREIRDRNVTIGKLRSELGSLHSQSETLKQLLDQHGVEIPEEDASKKPFDFEVTKVDFGFLTCAIDLDEVKGDDAIAAYVYLYDQFDSSLKAAGSFRLELFDMARSKDHLIQSWNYEPEAAAPFWQRFPGCYQFKLPLASHVHRDKVVLKVTFSRLGKGDLTATRELEIELP